MWSDVSGQVIASPSYGLEVNHLLVDAANDNNLEQLMNEPTRGLNTLDLLFSSEPSFISEAQVIPGISDHLAITFSLCTNAKLPTKPLDHFSLLFDKANLTAIKNDILHFQGHFLSSDLTTNNCESNWLNFKHMLDTTIDTNIPKVFHKSNNRLPWINHSIRQKMKQRKKLYNKAKRLHSQEAWSKYCTLKNTIIEDINQAHERYQNDLFNRQADIHHKKFWRYIKKLRKDQVGVPPLSINNTTLQNPKEKAEALNNQFYSVFTRENLSYWSCLSNNASYLDFYCWHQRTAYTA